MKSRLFIAVILAVNLTAASIPSQAQAPARPIGISPTGQPSTFDLRFEPYRITGYGRAQFGMTQAEVRAAIAADHPGAGAIADETEPLERTRVLTVIVPQLAPGPGAATASYVFGATSHRLVALNVSWLAAGNASDAQRQAIIAAGSKLVGEFTGSYWPPLATARGHVLAPGVVILFASRDADGHGVEVRLDGVPLQVQRPSGTGTARPFELVAPPPGPARLRLSLVANSDHPDIDRIAPGAF